MNFNLTALQNTPYDLNCVRHIRGATQTFHTQAKNVGIRCVVKKGRQVSYGLWLHNSCQGDGFHGFTTAINDPVKFSPLNHNQLITEIGDAQAQVACPISALQQNQSIHFRQYLFSHVITIGHLTQKGAPHAK